MSTPLELYLGGQILEYLIQHPVQLISCLHNTISIIAIYHKDQPLCILEVVPPQWPNLFKDCHDINSIIQNALMKLSTPKCSDFNITSLQTTLLEQEWTADKYFSNVWMIWHSKGVALKWLWCPHQNVQQITGQQVDVKGEKPQVVITLSWPPTSHTVKLMFLYSTVSTLKPWNSSTDNTIKFSDQQSKPASLKPSRRCRNPSRYGTLTPFNGKRIAGDEMIQGRQTCTWITTTITNQSLTTEPASPTVEI